MHHGELERQIFACPVKSLARRVAHIWVHTSDGTTIFCEYWDSVGRGDVIDRDISFHMKFAAEEFGYPSRNIPLDRIDTHSNQAGGACVKKLARFDNKSIGKMERWLPSSDEFLEYIQQQLLGFSQGMTTERSRITRFTNMEGSENHTGKQFHTVYGGRHYHNIFLHLCGNWAQKKDCVTVTFFAFLFLPKKTSPYIAPTQTR